MRYEAIGFACSLCPKFSKDSLTSRLEACSELEYFIELFGTLKIEYSAIEQYTKYQSEFGPNSEEELALK